MDEKNSRVEREDKDLEIDQSLLTEEEKKGQGYHFPLVPLIVCGAIAVLMLICIIVIICLSNAR